MQNEDKKISPVRIAQWVVDKLVMDNDVRMQQLLRSKNLSPEELESLYRTRLEMLAAQSKVRNIAEIYAEDDVSSLRFAAYKADDYLSALIGRINTFFEGKYVEINLSCAEECGNVMLDMRRTNLIIYNLISNAIIHSKVKDKKITVNAYMRGTDFVISVADNGRKIAAAKQKQLFFAYESIVVSGKKLADPLSLSGLGLSVCRKAAREMSGEVVYISSASHNVFEILIPQTQIGKFCETLVFVPDRDEIECCMALAILSLME